VKINNCTNSPENCEHRPRFVQELRKISTKIIILFLGQFTTCTCMDICTYYT